MVLRCSLLGHDYGEPEVDREREERGSEVVLTVRTYEECARCGDRHVISENTEITSLTPDERTEDVDRVGETTTQPPEGPGRDEPGNRRGPDPASTSANAADPSEDREGDWPRASADASGGRSDDPVRGPGGDGTSADRPSAPPTRDDATPGANTDGGTRSDDPEPRRDPTAPGEGTDPDDPATDRNVPTDDAGEPIEDGEILEGDDRKPGEWPDPDDVGPPTGDGSDERWPDLEIDRVGGEQLAYEDSDDEREGATDETDDAESGPAVTDSGTGIASAASAPVPGEDPVVEPVETEFYCPTCSFVAPGDHGSLRPGDICPDCGRGYIGERERK